MSYYRELKKMWVYLEKMLKKGGEQDYHLLIYNITNKFEVSEKSIQRRIELLIKIGKIDEVDGILIWKH